MPIYSTFVMGKKESYFFNTPTHWAWHNLPPDIEALFTQHPPIKDVIEFTFGPNGTYFISYRDSANNLQSKHYNLPNALTSWLYDSQPHVVRDLTTLSITLGPYDSYYAWDRNAASWTNLPPKLEKSILDRLETADVGGKTVWKAGGAEAPCFVSLGADEAYWMRTVSGGGCWDLKIGGGDGWDGLKGMNKFLEDSSDFSGIAGLHLFPSHANAYILTTTAGKGFSNLPECTWVDYNKMAAAFPITQQSMLPIPPIPQTKQQSVVPPQAQAQVQQATQPPHPQQIMYGQQPQQIYQQAQPPSQHNCCPSNTPGAPHNCCPQAPARAGPYGMPYAYQGSQAYNTTAPRQQQWQPNGYYTNVGYGGGHTYR